MKQTIAILILALSLAAASCSRKKQFTISGTIEGLGAQMVTATYYADGGMKRISQPATEGKFRLRGSSDEPTLCLIQAGSTTDLAVLVVTDGDKITLTGDINNPLAIKVEGNSVSTKIAEWTARNAAVLTSRNPQKINNAVAEFVKANTSSLAATALMVTRFQTPGFEQMADALLTSIKPEARPAAVVQNFSSVLASQLAKKTSRDVHPMTVYLRTDTLENFNPGMHSLNLLAFNSENHAARDSVIPFLRQLKGAYSTRQLEILEISSARDSAQWKTTTARDSARWNQVWAPGTIADTELNALAVPRYPYFIVADSLGSQLFRGSSVKAARRFIEQRLKSSH